MKSKLVSLLKQHDKTAGMSLAIGIGVVVLIYVLIVFGNMMPRR